MRSSSSQKFQLRPSIVSELFVINGPLIKSGEIGRWPVAVGESKNGENDTSIAFSFSFVWEVDEVKTLTCSLIWFIFSLIFCVYSFDSFKFWGLFLVTIPFLSLKTFSLKFYWISEWIIELQTGLIREIRNQWESRKIENKRPENKFQSNASQ